MDTGRDAAFAGGVCKEMKRDGRGADEEQMMNQTIFPFPDIPTVVFSPPLLSHGSSPLLCWPMATAKVCNKRAAEGRSHGYLVRHSVLLPQGHLDPLLWPWEMQLHCQLQLPMATVSNAVLPPAPACGLLTTPAASGATQPRWVSPISPAPALHHSCSSSLLFPSQTTSSSQTHLREMPLHQHQFFLQLLKLDRAWLCFHGCNLQLNLQEMQSDDLT